jgi:methionyl-tRNA synthetase
MKEQIGFEEFLEIEKKLEIKWGRISSVERVPKSKKMLKLEVIFSTGTTEPEVRTVMTNIGDQIENEQALKWLTFPFVTNLKPATIMGIESTAMIVPSTENGKILFSANFPSPGSILM